MGRDALDEVSAARARRRSGGGELLVEDHVEYGGQVVTTEPGGPREPEEAGVVERRVPVRLAGPVHVVGRRDRQTRVVLGDPGAQAPPELRLRRRVTKVHRQLPAGFAAAAAAARRR